MTDLQIRKPQIKVIEESVYGVAPSYPLTTDDNGNKISDSSKIAIIDPITFGVTPNQNLQTVETLSTQDVSDVALGDYKYSGNIEFPVRISQLSFINHIGLGNKFITPVYKDVDADPTTPSEIVANQYISIPTIDKFPSFTLYSLETKPEVIRKITGTVFTDYKISINKGKVTTASFNYGARINKDIYSKNDAEFAGDNVHILDTMPISQGDLAAAQDIGIYSEIEIVDIPYDETSDTVKDFSNDKELIDFIITEIPDYNSGESTKIYKAIFGKKMVNVKSLNLNVSTTNYVDDSTRIGDRFSQEFGMTTVQRLNYTADLTTDYITEDAFSELMDKYLGRNINPTEPPSTPSWSPNQVDYGALSVVVKFGSAKGIRNLNKTPDIHSYDFHDKADIVGKNAGEVLDAYLEPIGSPKRGIMILPNVVLVSLSDISKQVGTIPELRFNTMILPDAPTGPFSDLEIEYKDNNASQKLNVSQQKLLAITHDVL